MKEIPFKKDLPGKIYGSWMPYGDHDRERNVIQEFNKHNISTIVLLASDKECLEKAKQDLRSLYKEEGYDVIYLPIEDYKVPAKARLEEVIDKTIALAMGGSNIVVHCSAGIGRTGMFIACLAKRLNGISGQQAIKWVRLNYTLGAVETIEQKKLVIDF